MPYWRLCSQLRQARFADCSGYPRITRNSVFLKGTNLDVAIHSTAIIDKQAEIPASAEIGPYAIIEGAVRLGERVRVYPHAYLNGWTEIGDDCEIHPHAVIGHLPQDFHFDGSRSYCRIGAGTIMREGVSIHRGTQAESETVVGPNCFLLANSHVGHNCTLGANVKLMNGALLSGHVELENNVIVSGVSGVHQFVNVGQYAMVAGLTKVIGNVLPFMTVMGNSECVGYNAIGLRRSQKFSNAEINEVRLAYRMIYRTGKPFSEAVESFRAVARESTGQAILAFYDAGARRGFAGRPAAMAARKALHEPSAG